MKFVTLCTDSKATSINISKYTFTCVGTSVLKCPSILLKALHVISHICTFIITHINSMSNYISDFDVNYRDQFNVIQIVSLCYNVHSKTNNHSHIYACVHAQTYTCVSNVTNVTSDYFL